MALPRRTLLTAGAVAAVGAAAGSTVWKQREIDRVAREPVPSPMPDDPRAPQSNITGGTFLSQARGGVETKWFIVAPPTSTAPLRPVIALHMYDGSAESAIGLGAARALSRAAAAGAPPIALASVDGGARAFWHRRESGEDPAAMIIDEFLPLLESQGLDVSRVGFLGWSMGGYGALLLGARLGAPRTAAICAVSPALYPQGDYLEGAFDSRQDYLDNNVWGLRALDDIPIRIDCGTEDSLYPACRQFAAQLARTPAGSFSQGGHDNAYWSAQLPAELGWLAGYVGSEAPR